MREVDSPAPERPTLPLAPSLQGRGRSLGQVTHPKARSLPVASTCLEQISETIAQEPLDRVLLIRIFHETDHRGDVSGSQHINANQPTVPVIVGKQSVSLHDIRAYRLPIAQHQVRPAEIAVLADQQLKLDHAIILACHPSARDADSAET